MARPSAQARRRHLPAEPMPLSVAPMLAVLAPDLPTPAGEYSFEYKWDGIRALCYCDRGRLRIESRNRLDITHRYPELGQLAAALDRQRAILDGEIIAFDASDKPSFPLLQRRMHVQSPESIQRRVHEVPIAYVIFDLLYLDGRSTMPLPLVQRRTLLEELTLRGPAWQLSPAYAGEGRPLLESARRQRLEGVMAKRLDSVYEPGRRSPAWLKIKLVQRQELVIGGWIPEGGVNRGRVGALLVGYYDPSDPAPRRLHYAGAVGSGFDAQWHRELTQLLTLHRSNHNPFGDPVPRPGVLFVRPELVAEVEYRRWPDQGLIQQATFKGLRPDRKAQEIIPERICER